MEVCFNKRELKKFLKDNKPLGEGTFGLVYNFNDDCLIKAYVDEEKRKNYKEIYRDINESKIQEEYYMRLGDPIYTSRDRDLRRVMDRLSYTKYSYDLVQGLAYYYEYCFGSILKYYNNYTVLDDGIVSELPMDALNLLFHNIDIALEDLINNHIYPIDLKEDNIMYDDNMNIKLIDLDDCLTAYANSYSDYYERECLSSAKNVKKEILRCKKL